MRVLMTTDTVGGVWTFTKELAIELLKNRCAVALVSLGRLPSPMQREWVDAQEARWGEQFLFRALNTPLEWMSENERAHSEAAPILLEVAEEFEAELLLSSQYCFGELEFRIPRVVVAHSDVLSWAEACRAEGLQPSSWLDRYRELVAQGLEHADAVVAPTRWMLKAIGTNFRLPYEQRVIPNGRRMPAFVAGSERKLQCVTAGRLWDEAKNLRVLEEVDSPMPLVFAGERELESARLTVSSNDVKWLGALDEAEMLKAFRESAIYICTSRYEPFGLAPLEAALCGCAVLANDISSLREVWGDAALYFAGPESLSEWLWRLGDHAGLLNEAQRSSMRRAREFTAERMGAGYLELFRSMLKQVMVGRHVA
ncbi:MAG TPA: glycosyltransferase family 4 protein [Terracidiphilus sp.]|jgi:glycosyltransferase involved in cell wall biosynthesis